MAVSVTWQVPADVTRVIDALLEAAERHAITKPLLSARYRVMANDLGDALDRSPVSIRSLPPFVPDQLAAGG